MTINAYTIGANLYHANPADSAAEVARLKGQVDIAAILGCSVMRHDVCYGVGKTGTSRSFGLMLPTIADNARAVTEYAATKGVRTCTENHGFVAQDSYRVEQLFNAVAHDNYGLLVDVGNFVCADEDNCAAVSRVAPYAVHVHAKDMYKSATPAPGFGQTRGCNYFKGAIVGEGDCNVEKCLQILKRAGYDGYCSIEFEGSEDCIEGIAKGFENLKGMLERI
jgi:sugar phosphate isomerase/epimerase